MDREEYAGADGTTFPSTSVALSRLLPGPAVPGFQNFVDIFGGVELELNVNRRNHDDYCHKALFGSGAAEHRLLTRLVQT